jgi:hypothetical protein
VIDKGSQRGLAMRVKAIAFLIIIAGSAAAFVALRSENRADAAGGNCYSATSGPSTPTICS